MRGQRSAGHHQPQEPWGILCIGVVVTDVLLIAVLSFLRDPKLSGQVLVSHV